MYNWIHRSALWFINGLCNLHHPFMNFLGPHDVITVTPFKILLYISGYTNFNPCYLTCWTSLTSGAWKAIYDVINHNDTWPHGTSDVRIHYHVVTSYEREMFIVEGNIKTFVKERESVGMDEVFSAQFSNGNSWLRVGDAPHCNTAIETVPAF